jgi:hypothetical protein
MMKRANQQLAESDEGALLAALDARMKLIARETFKEMSAQAEAGAVKVKTAAGMLDMSEFRVRQLIKDGTLKAIRPTPNTIRIPLSEIRRFEEGRQ